MLKCEECGCKFESTGSKTDVVFMESCPRCGSQEVGVHKNVKPVYRFLLILFVLVLLLSTIVFPIMFF